MPHVTEHPSRPAGSWALLMLIGSVVACRAPAVDASLDKRSASGTYRVALQPMTQPIPIERMHAWRIRLTTADGQPVTGATWSVEGGMPEHRHGLPTRPEVTEESGGAYRIDGMKFSMPGHWVLDLTFWVNERRDSAHFDLVLP